MAKEVSSMKFLNRTQELASLDNKWNEHVPHLVVVYGRRRVGKTELIKQFIKNKPAVYFLADRRTTTEHLREVGRLFGAYFKDFVLEKRGFGEWMEVFQYLERYLHEPFVFVIDEYPYLVEVDRSISSVFQKGWDEHLKNTNIFFIMCGSSISMMESEALTYKSPLYGRRTGQILVQPLSFHESWKFFPKQSFDEFLGIYTITGGLPAYLMQLSPELSLKENILKKIFPNTEFLHNEVEFVLKEELREPKNYLSILRAISMGKRKFGEIANETALEKNVLTKYLNTLEHLKLIEKEVPVTEKNLLKSRKSLYVITDNFFRFWFQYVFPYKSSLEIGQFNEVLRIINESFPLLQAATYEKVCREVTWNLSHKIFQFERVGKWWEKEQEIDVVGVNRQTGQILFGEAKWSVKPVGINIFEALKRKAHLVDWEQNSRKEHFILFSRNGFTKEMLNVAKKENVFLVEKDRLLEGGK
jgi:AAA+ ATPase superfamily predicted ATPase